MGSPCATWDLMVRMVAVDPLCDLGCGLGHLWIRFVYPVHPVSTQIRFGSGNFGGRVGDLGLFACCLVYLVAVAILWLNCLGQQQKRWLLFWHIFKWQLILVKIQGSYSKCMRNQCSVYFSKSFFFLEVQYNNAEPVTMPTNRREKDDWIHWKAEFIDQLQAHEAFQYRSWQAHYFPEMSASLSMRSVS